MLRKIDGTCFWRGEDGLCLSVERALECRTAVPSPDMKNLVKNWDAWKKEYPGKWLAINSTGEKVICSGEDPKLVREDAESKAEVGTVPILIKLPGEGEDDSPVLY